MSDFGITKTVPKTAGREALDRLFDGSLERYEFHMAATMKKIQPGDWVYTIFDDQLHGRCRITRLIEGGAQSCSGHPRTLVIVACPGERLAEPIPRKGHQGTRYFDGEGWPG